MKTIYIAGVFRAEDRWTMAQNIHRAREYGMEIARLGAVPIITHSMFGEFYGTFTPEFWNEATATLMRMADGVFFMPGWKTSEHVQSEWDHAQTRRQPCFDRIADLQEWLETGLPQQVPAGL